jgi:integrase
MARGINLLTSRFVTTTTAPGKHADGGGLYLRVRQRSEQVERLWLFRYKRGTRVKAKELNISIGTLRTVSLASARKMAQVCREAIARGEDPKVALRKLTASGPTFGEVADALIESLEPSFRNEKTAASWKRTLGDMYCSKLRSRPVAEVGTEDVLEVLRSIWNVKPETAAQIRERIERVLDAAKVQGLRTGENPARWKGHLKFLLPAQTAKKNHHRALSYTEMPTFVVQLKGLDSISALALEWTILTAARTGEALGAPRTEINRADKIWTIPAERMKENREHRVPLCDRCIEIFDELAAFGSPWLFPARNPKEHMSEMSMALCLRRLKVDATVHGFRSTFRDWAGDCTSFPREIAEAALSHLVGDEAERAYRRSDALERRRKLMLAWERYCLQGASNVIQLATKTEAAG